MSQSTSEPHKVSLIGLGVMGGAIARHIAEAGHELTIHHAGQITEKIFNLKKMEGVLQEMAAQCNQGNVPKCPIIDSLFDA